MNWLQFSSNERYSQENQKFSPEPNGSRWYQSIAQQDKCRKPGPLKRCSAHAAKTNQAHQKKNKTMRMNSKHESMNKKNAWKKQAEQRSVRNGRWESCHNALKFKSIGVAIYQGGAETIPTRPRFTPWDQDRFSGNTEWTKSWEKGKRRGRSRKERKAKRI